MSVLAPKAKYRPYLELGDKCLQLFSRFEDKELCKLVFGAQWNTQDKCWEYPLRPETLSQLAAIFPGLSVDPRVRLAVTEIQSREALAAQIKA